MRRSDRDSSGDVMQKRGRAADQRFLMKARGDRFQLPKYFNLVAEPRLLLLLITVATLMTMLLVFDFQPQMTLTMFSAILAKSTKVQLMRMVLQQPRAAQPSNLQLMIRQRCLICM